MADTLTQRLAGIVNRPLHALGLHLARRERAFDMDGLLGRAAVHHPEIRTWIDVGASDGSWTLRAHHHFPNAAYVLFEPLAERQPALARLARRHGFHIVAAAAGAACGEIAFAVDPELDGSGVAGPEALQTRRVPVQTLEGAIADRALPGPYAIKLDTHGFEIPILEGAAGLLKTTHLLIIESYNFELTSGCMRFHELCAFLEQRGFRCCDLADPMRRPGDGVLWQMDLAFARVDHPVFRSNRYDGRT